MSHIAKVKSVFKDHKILKKVLDKMKIPCKTGKHTVNLYEGNRNGIFSFTPNGWRYPMLIQESGEVLYDNYNGGWGKIEEFEGITKAYVKEVTITNMKKKGYYLTKETVDAEGEVELTFMGR